MGQLQFVKIGAAHFHFMSGSGLRAGRERRLIHLLHTPLQIVMKSPFIIVTLQLLRKKVNLTYESIRAASE